MATRNKPRPQPVDLGVCSFCLAKDLKHPRKGVTVRNGSVLCEPHARPRKR